MKRLLRVKCLAEPTGVVIIVSMMSEERWCKCDALKMGFIGQSFHQRLSSATTCDGIISSSDALIAVSLLFCGYILKSGGSTVRIVHALMASDTCRLRLVRGRRQGHFEVMAGQRRSCRPRFLVFHLLRTVCTPPASRVGIAAIGYRAAEHKVARCRSITSTLA